MKKRFFKARKFSAIFLSAALITGSFAGNLALSAEQTAAGTADDPIIISTADELRSMVSSGGNGQYYKLANDIAVNDTNADNWYEQENLTQWLYSSWWDNSFYGTIDGDGHTITGLYNNLTNASGGTMYCGFIPFLSEYGPTVIRNLKIDKSYFRISDEQEVSVGAFVGNEGGRNLTLTSCAVGKDVTINCESSSGNQIIGGFVGALGGGLDTLTITDCISELVNVSTTTNGSIWVGSLFGHGWGTQISANNVLSTGLKLKGNDSAEYNAVINGGFTTVNLEDTIGEKAKTTLTGFDFDLACTWATIENGYPTLSIFNGQTEKGTAENPIMITTASELKRMVESGGNGKYYKLTNDIAVNDTSADNWYEQENLTQWIYTVNGNWDYCFYGTIDGGGHTVTGLYNNLNDSNIAYCGFISVLHDKGPTVIRNLKIDRSYFRVNNNEGETHIGTFVGAMNGRNLTLENCAVGEDVTIFCKTKDGDPMIGGFVGSLGGSGSFTATNCLTDFADGDAETSGAPSWDPGTPCQPRIGSLYGKTWGAQIKVNNVLSTGLKLQGNESTGNNAVINGAFKALNLEDTIGENAKTTLWTFDFDNVWLTVDDGFPALRTFFILRGDVNNDNIVDIRDLIHMKKDLVQTEPAYSEKADINEDGIFNTMDLAALREVLLGVKKN